VLALSSPEKASPREDVVDQCGRVKCMVPRHRETEKEREKGGGGDLAGPCQTCGDVEARVGVEFALRRDSSGQARLCHVLCAVCP